MAPGLVVVGVSKGVGLLPSHQDFGVSRKVPSGAVFALSTFQKMSNLPAALAAGTTAAWCARRSRQKKGGLGVSFQRCPGFVRCKAHQEQSHRDCGRLGRSHLGQSHLEQCHQEDDHHESASNKLIQEVLQTCTTGIAVGLGVVLIFKAILLGEHTLVSSENYAWAAPILGGAAVTGCYYLLGGEGNVSGTSLADLKTLATDRVNKPASLSAEERGKRAAVRSALAVFTLSTGNPLGPEGPCVEMAANVAAYFGRFGERQSEVNASILASACAAGFSAGFNAPLAGLIFAWEVVKPPKDESITSISRRLLAATCGAAMVQILLGATPPLTGVQFEDFRTSSFAFGEVPLFAILGAFCGVLSALFELVRSKSAVLWKQLPIPRTMHPLMASLLVSAVVYFGNMPFLLYRGFDNINAILTHADEMGFMQLAMLIAAKIIVSSMANTSGLVGGVFAPALFIGASGGAVYGKGLSLLATQAGFSNLVSSTVDYSAVGAAACMGSMCGMPVTSIVLLLEVSGAANYSIVLPFTAAVGMSTFLFDYILTYVSDANKAAQGTVKRVTMTPGDSLFDYVDGNHDGVVSKEEFKAWYRELDSPVRLQLQKL